MPGLLTRDWDLVSSGKLHFFLCTERKIEALSHMSCECGGAKKTLFNLHLDRFLNCLDSRCDQGAVGYTNCNRSDHSSAFADSHTYRDISDNVNFFLGRKISCPTCSLASQWYLSHPSRPLRIFHRSKTMSLYFWVDNRMVYASRNHTRIWTYIMAVSAESRLVWSLWRWSLCSVSSNSGLILNGIIYSTVVFWNFEFNSNIISRK